MVNVWRGDRAWSTCGVVIVRGQRVTLCVQEYLARVDWLANSTLTVQVQNRNQTTLKLVRHIISRGYVARHAAA